MDDESISAGSINITKIVEIGDKHLGEQVDVLAIIMDEGFNEEILLKSGKTKVRRVCRLVDDSNYAIDLTIWGEKA